VVGFGILALLAYIAFLLRRRYTTLGARLAGHEEEEQSTPKLGLGLVSEVNGKGRIGELAATNGEMVGNDNASVIVFGEQMNAWNRSHR